MYVTLSFGVFELKFRADSRNALEFVFIIADKIRGVLRALPCIRCLLCDSSISATLYTHWFWLNHSKQYVAYLKNPCSIFAPWGTVMIRFSALLPISAPFRISAPLRMCFC